MTSVVAAPARTERRAGVHVGCTGGGVVSARSMYGLVARRAVEAGHLDGVVAELAVRDDGDRVVLRAAQRRDAVDRQALREHDVVQGLRRERIGGVRRREAGVGERLAVDRRRRGHRRPQLAGPAGP